jgi:hypothetical protein
LILARLLTAAAGQNFSTGRYLYSIFFRQGNTLRSLHLLDIITIGTYGLIKGTAHNGEMIWQPMKLPLSIRFRQQRNKLQAVAQEGGLMPGG